LPRDRPSQGGLPAGRVGEELERGGSRPPHGAGMLDPTLEDRRPRDARADAELVEVEDRRAKDPATADADRRLGRILRIDHHRLHP